MRVVDEDDDVEIIEEDDIDEREEFETPHKSAGEHIVEYTKDRTKVIFLLGEEEYTAVKPKKSEEWFIELQMAMSADDTGRLLLEIDNFFRKIVGNETAAAIKKRRLDDDDEISWSDMSEVMKEIFEIWTSEADKPVRPTGRRSASSSGKRRTTRR